MFGRIFVRKIKGIFTVGCNPGYRIGVDPEYDILL